MVQHPHPKPLPTRLIPLLGLVQWGDLGHVTIYRTQKGKPVFFPKTYPDKPPSPAQIAHRQKMIDAANAWQQLSLAQRNIYNRAIRKLSLAITPFGLYFTLSLPQNAQLKRTIEFQAKETLP